MYFKQLIKIFNYKMLRLNKDQNSYENLWYKPIY